MNSDSIKDLAVFRRKKLIEIAKKKAKFVCGNNGHFLKTRTWNYPIADITSIIKQTPFVIIGGVATRMYMLERRTHNLDILIQFQDASTVEKQLQTFNAKQLSSLNFGGTCWQLVDGSFLNVISLNEPWVIEAVLNPNYHSTGLPIISLPYLVLIKLKSSRPQDLADISRMLGGANKQQLQRTREIIELYLSDVVDDLEDLIWLGQLEY